MCGACRADDIHRREVWRAGASGMAGLTTVTSSIPLAQATFHRAGWQASQVVTLKGFWHDHAAVLIVKPLQVLAVIVVALLARGLVHRAVDKLTRSSAQGKVPRILSPLTERAANYGFFESSGLLSERRRLRTETIGSILKSLVSFLVFVTAFLIVLGEIGVDLLPFVAGTSLVGVALGFGAQNVVKDFLSGIFMILEDQYGVGDVIDVKEATGTVEAVGLRTTRLRDTEGTVWYVRNGEIVRVGNQSQQFAQVVLDIPIGPTDDLDAALSRLNDAANGMYGDEHWRAVFLGQPEVLGVQSMSRDETVLRVVVRVRPLEQWRAGRELRARIRTALLEDRSES
jgi:moderate conductance mechanosensitive channel